ncbi:MAG: hypothetical protein KDE27_24040 [Planctomycetes bacterium]|nr:hypothetical protein [Planctomycetota bacterium]
MRGTDLLALLLAALGLALGVEAWLAGSLFRYVLAGIAVGAVLCVPLLSILLLRDRARRFWRLTSFALVPVALLLLCAEIGIRFAGPVYAAPARIVSDEDLGHAVLPGTGETDAWGFRNERVPERADALFVGDSQTWGFFLEREQSFPAQFGELTGLSTYQMANGGYGPVRYRELVRRGLALQPKLVVVGFYFGNDLWDACSGAGLPNAEDLRDPKRSYGPPRPPEAAEEHAPNWVMGGLDWLQQSSRLVGLAGETVKARLRGTASVLDAQPGAIAVTEGNVGTLLLPKYREPALDLRNKTLADALRVSEQCLQDIGSDCAKAGCKAVLLAIPTKEYCYAEWLKAHGRAMPELEELRSRETAVRARVFAAAKAGGLELVDLAPICIAALQADTPIWAGNGDGHLNANGHRAAAQAIAGIWPGK